MTELDPVIHAQARLRVTATLAALPPGDRISFPRLQKILSMTAGNLSTHLRKLEEENYIAVTKTHSGRTPATFIALTTAGRAAFRTYSRALHELLALPLDTSEPGTSPSGTSPSGSSPPGTSPSGSSPPGTSPSGSSASGSSASGSPAHVTTPGGNP